MTKGLQITDLFFLNASRNSLAISSQYAAMGISMEPSYLKYENAETVRIMTLQTETLENEKFAFQNRLPTFIQG
jgi:hypothetical protein